MALVLTEPFNNFTTNGWSNVSGFTIVAGRTGTCAQQTAASQTLIYTIAAGSRTDTWTLGVAVKIDSLAAERQIFANRSAPASTLEQLFFVTTAGAIRVQNPATTSYTSANGLITANTWAYIEAQVVYHNTAGSIVVRVNGTTVINQTGIDTISGASTVFDQIRLVTNSAATIQWDDLYLRNDLTFQGDPNPPPSPIKVWNGSAFVDAVAVKTWNGSAFV